MERCGNNYFVPAFQWLIQYAIDNNIQMRALGNGWSFSEVAVCEGGLIDTKALRLSYNLKNSFVAPEYFATLFTASLKMR